MVQQHSWNVLGIRKVIASSQLKCELQQAHTEACIPRQAAQSICSSVVDGDGGEQRGIKADCHILRLGEAGRSDQIQL